MKTSYFTNNTYDVHGNIIKVGDRLKGPDGSFYRLVEHEGEVFALRDNDSKQEAHDGADFYSECEIDNLQA